MSNLSPVDLLEHSCITVRDLIFKFIDSQQKKKKKPETEMILIPAERD